MSLSNIPLLRPAPGIRDTGGRDHPPTRHPGPSAECHRDAVAGNTRRTSWRFLDKETGRLKCTWYPTHSIPQYYLGMHYTLDTSYRTISHIKHLF